MALRSSRALWTALRVFEAERKFSPTAKSLLMLLQNSGDPPFSVLTRLEDKTHHDKYYDSNDILVRAGIWVRRRNGIWQAKRSHGGDYVNSHFREFSGAEEVEALVAPHIDGARFHPNEQSGLDLMANFKTWRMSWRANNQFNIVIDKTDFGHCVGEVELTLETQDDHEEVPDTAVTEGMHVDLINFMQQYFWAFPTKGATGKLAAYFASQSHSEPGRDRTL